MRTFFIAGALALCALTSNATEYHVAKTGNDNNSGTATQPFLTITEGVSHLQAGDDLIVHAGTYNEVVTIWDIDGTALAPIYIRAAQGETVVIDGSHMSSLNPVPNGVVIIGASEWIHFNDFIVEDSATAGILIWGGKNIFVKWNEVRNCQKFGIHAGQSTWGHNTNITIEGNYVHHNVMNNTAHSESFGWTQGLSVMYTDGATIRENWVSNNHGEGIDVIASQNVTVDLNTVHDNFSCNIYLDNAKNTVVDSNYIYSELDEEFYRDGGPAPGIVVANEDYSYDIANPSSGLTITNNVVLRTGSGFRYGDWGLGGGLQNTKVANNTFYATENATLWIDDDTHGTTVIENNIIYQTGGDYAWVPSTTGITYNHNAWYGGNYGMQTGTGDVTTNPGFVNAGGWTKDDYKLTTTSNVRTAGAALSYVPQDGWGNSRTTSYSMGAHERN